jgi:hypothetical protein
MSEMQGVSIVIYQNGQVVAELETDQSGQANVVLNAGTYTIQFSYPGRLPVSFQVTLDNDNTFLMFAFPAIEHSGGWLLTVPEFSQDGDFTPSTAKTFTTTPVFTNT